VGEIAPGVLAAGGYSGHGLALAGITGQAMAQQILGDGRDFARLSRLPVPALPGGRGLGPWIARAGLGLYGLRDRLGI